MATSSYACGGDYFDPHAALAGEVELPVTLAAGAAGLGRLLDPAAGEADVAPGAAVGLPAWLAAELLGRNMADLRALPPEYGGPARRALSTGAPSVRFRGRSPYFYTAALALSTLRGAPDLTPLAAHALRQRYAPLLARCLAPSDAARADARAVRAPGARAARVAADPASLMSVEEAALHGAGAAALAALDRWRAVDWRGRNGAGAAVEVAAQARAAGGGGHGGGGNQQGGGGAAAKRARGA